MAAYRVPGLQRLNSKSRPKNNAYWTVNDTNAHQREEAAQAALGVGRHQERMGYHPFLIVVALKHSPRRPTSTGKHSADS